MIPYEDLAAALAGQRTPSKPAFVAAPTQVNDFTEDDAIHAPDNTDASSELDIGEVLSDEEV